MRLKPWPLALCGFFLVVVSVNVFMIYQAAQGYQGLLDQQPYKKGLGYDTERAQVAAFEALGWNAEFTPDPLTLTLRDKDGLLIRDARVTIRALRPNAASEDVTAELKNSALGNYAASSALHSGRWLIEVIIEHQEKTYRFNRTALVESEKAITLKGV